MSLDINLLAGLVLDHKYELLSIAGSGGMGVVYKARQAHVERTVAVKMLQHSQLQDNDAMARFEREAVALSKLSHKHIATFYSYGVWDQSSPYIVMEYLEGKSLAELIGVEQRIGWQRALRIITQLCEAVEHAHKNGMIHRDLKPGNILLVEKPHSDFVKVVDFGLAKIIAADGKEAQKLTQTGAVLGSVQYMCPELCLGHEADSRSDIYSLGCILYECLCGLPPHAADNPIGLMHKHVSELAIAPSKRIQDQLPIGLDQIVLKCLAKKPANRYQSMAALRQDLEILASESEQPVSALLDSKDNSQYAGSKAKLLKLGGFAGLIVLLAGGTFVSLRDKPFPGGRITHSKSSDTEKAEQITSAADESKLNSQYEELTKRARMQKDPKIAESILKECLQLSVPKRRLDLRLNALEKAVSVCSSEDPAAALKYSREMLAITSGPEIRHSSVDLRWRYFFRLRSLDSAIKIDLVLHKYNDALQLINEEELLTIHDFISAPEKAKILLWKISIYETLRSEEVTKTKLALLNLERSFLDSVKKNEASSTGLDMENAESFCKHLRDSHRFMESKKLMLQIIPILKDSGRLSFKDELIGISSIAECISYVGSSITTLDEAKSLSKRFLICLDEPSDAKQFSKDGEYFSSITTQQTLKMVGSIDKRRVSKVMTAMSEDERNIKTALSLAGVLRSFRDNIDARKFLTQASAHFKNSSSWTPELRNTWKRLAQ